MVESDSGWALAATTAAVLVGVVVVLAGAGTLVSLLFFPDSALGPGTPLAAYPWRVQVLLAALVLAAGLALAGVPIGRAVAEMYRVRAEADAEPGPGEDPQGPDHDEGS